MTDIGSRLCETVHRALHETITAALTRHAARAGALLDVGCWDGGNTVAYGDACRAHGLFGVEVCEDQARAAERQAIEVARCFEEGVSTDARDADIGSILAWGFAPFTGGCCSYVDLIWGIKEFVAEADRLADKYGDRFRPNALLRDMAAKGEGFYDRFPPAGTKAKVAA